LLAEKMYFSSGVMTRHVTDSLCPLNNLTSSGSGAMS